MKKALICGVSGQDGSYLAKLLLEARVFGLWDIAGCPNVFFPKFSAFRHPRSH